MCITSEWFAVLYDGGNRTVFVKEAFAYSSLLIACRACRHSTLTPRTPICSLSSSTLQTVTQEQTQSKVVQQFANASLPRELTRHMVSHSVTYQPADVTFPPLPQPKLVLDLATPEGYKVELTWLVG